MSMTTRIRPGLGFLVSLCIAGCKPVQFIWKVDQLGQIGGHAVEVLGAPKFMTDGDRKALCFDGAQDGLVVNANPLQGWREFTVRVLFKPDGDGREEQRFLHIEDDQQHRLLIETRVNQGRTWSLDTFLRNTDQKKLTLLDRTRTQPTDQWYWATLTYDGNTMRHYVDGELQLEGRLKFPRMTAGKISLGVRQNKVHWFKGCIARVEFTAAALDPKYLGEP
jgi:hypothetical protein